MNLLYFLKNKNLPLSERRRGFERYLKSQGLTRKQINLAMQAIKKAFS